MPAASSIRRARRGNGFWRMPTITTAMTAIAASTSFTIPARYVDTFSRIVGWIRLSSRMLRDMGSPSPIWNDGCSSVGFSPTIVDMAVEDTTVSSLVGEPGRLATVLFADVSDSTKLYETLGDKIAHAAIGGCIDGMKRATQAAGGRGGKTI